MSWKTDYNRATHKKKATHTYIHIQRQRLLLEHIHSQYIPTDNSVIQDTSKDKTNNEIIPMLTQAYSRVSLTEWKSSENE